MRTDAQIRDDILDEIDWEPRIDSTEVGVTVKGGTVSLMGVVDSYSERLAIESAAKRVKGVQVIADEIKVKFPSDIVISDEDIADQIAQVLKWNLTTDSNKIQAMVRNGLVTLTGEVVWNYRRSDAATHVASIRGVSEVRNEIKVKSRAQKKDVAKEIARALHRNANIEASHITVDVAGSRVTISGNVRAWYERTLVEEAVWAAPGVTEIVDNLQISNKPH